MRTTTSVVFGALFALIVAIGFGASRWRRGGGDLKHLHEWGLGGRRFGNWTTWFLLAGDLYTAYTFIAVPALMFGVGAFGFFAMPYVILMYPLVFALLPRLWSVSKRHHFITLSDFVAGRYGSQALALAIAVIGIVATLPYIALQIVGLQAVIAALGFPMHGWGAELPLVLAFTILAAFTYTSGLRAPASIAIVKDALVYTMVVAMIMVLPLKIGGMRQVFAAIPPEKLLLPAIAGHDLGLQSLYATLAFGSALAMMFYPHAVTGVLATKSADVLRRNWVVLPAYSFVLGMIALLGYVAYARGLDKLPELAPYFKQYGPQFALPGLLLHDFPAWCAGIGLAAIAIGALVPAGIMSIAAANLFTRNIYKPCIDPACDAGRETTVAKLSSLVLKLGALSFVLFLPLRYAIQLQLLSGIVMLQVVPTIIAGLYTRWFDARALLLGMLGGFGWGMWAASLSGFTDSGYTLHLGSYVIPAYIGVEALLINLAMAVAATPVLRRVGRMEGVDVTSAADYLG